jgi:adenylate cyclase
MKKFTFRTHLTTILLTLLTLTVAALGYSSYRQTRFIAEDMSTQILDQTSQRVDAQVGDLLHIASVQGHLNARLLESGQFDVHPFPKLAHYWLEVMHTHPWLTRLSVGLEASGEWFYVRRQLDRQLPQLAIGELRRNAVTGKLELTDYLEKGYPSRRARIYFNADKTDEDPRARPWYQRAKEAKEARRQIWSETYVFFGIEGVADVPGVSCATPVFAPDGSLRGVLTSSFDLYELCHYLKELHVGNNGYAFVVEFRSDGQRVIAHPEQQLLLRPAAKGGAAGVHELVPPENLADPRVQAFLRELPRHYGDARAKEKERLHFVHDDVHYLGYYRVLSGKDAEEATHKPAWIICVILPEEEVLGSVWRSSRFHIWIGLSILFLATLLSLFVARRISRPLGRLMRETEAIGQLKVEAHPVAHSLVLEVDRLAVATEQTKTSLRSFRKYIPADLVRHLLASGQEARLGGESLRLTIYFSDLANFTSLSEGLPPEKVVRQLGDYFGAFSAEILATGGTVDKYIGDAIMAFWGAPETLPAHALAACVTALHNQAALRALRQRWQTEGRPLLFARIGLHTGEVVVGNIGNEARLNYTVMGDAVNLASRLEGLNKYYGTEILISEHTYCEAQAALVARPVDWVSVKGKTEAVLIYELLGVPKETAQSLEDVAELSSRALDLYRQRDWAGAIRLFEQILGLRTGDGPAQVLVARCGVYRTHPPPEDWAGVHHMDSK